MASVAAVGFPRLHAPPGTFEFVVFPGVSGEANPHKPVVASLNAPGADIVGNAFAVNGVAIGGSSCGVGVRWVKEYAGDPVLNSGRFPAYAEPITGTDAHGAKTARKFMEEIVDALPSIPEVRKFAVDAEPGIPKVRKLALHTAVRFSFDKFSIHGFPRART